MTMLKSALVLCGFCVVLLLAAQVWGGPDKKGDPKAAATYLGAAECKRCHMGSHRSWKKMKHAKAWDVLKAEHRKPTATDKDGRACISCHVTGFGDAKRGGFVDAKSSKHLLGVQCEACHGPGSRHRDAAKKLQAAKKEFKPDDSKFIVRKTTKCADCHNLHTSHAKFAAKPGAG